MSVTEYFTKLRIIWDELENFRPNPMCTCPVKCSCSVISIINQRKCEDRAMQFLRGLNDQYKKYLFSCFAHGSHSCHIQKNFHGCLTRV